MISMGALEAVVRIIEAVLQPVGIFVGVVGALWLLKRMGLWTSPLPGQRVKSDSSKAGPDGVERTIEYHVENVPGVEERPPPRRRR